jgi:hypothetical protein
MKASLWNLKTFESMKQGFRNEEYKLLARGIWRKFDNENRGLKLKMFWETSELIL